MISDTFFDSSLLIAVAAVLVSVVSVVVTILLKIRATKSMNVQIGRGKGLSVEIKDLDEDQVKSIIRTLEISATGDVKVSTKGGTPTESSNEEPKQDGAKGSNDGQ